MMVRVAWKIRVSCCKSLSKVIRCEGCTGLNFQTWYSRVSLTSLCLTWRRIKLVCGLVDGQKQALAFVSWSLPLSKIWRELTFQALKTFPEPHQRTVSAYSKDFKRTSLQVGSCLREFYFHPFRGGFPLWGRYGISFKCLEIACN